MTSERQAKEGKNRKDRLGYLLFFLFALTTSCLGQTGTALRGGIDQSDTTEAMTSHGPESITRTIIQDRKGNIWMAAFDGIFRYDGKSFFKITGELTSDRFFSVLEDRKGNLWFGSIGSGVFCYDGQSFRNFNIMNGLVNNDIFCIYEDKAGNIWFGANGGLSRYDGKSFRNFIMKGTSIAEDKTGEILPGTTRTPNEVNAIIQDRAGRYWIATRGFTFIYDGNAFAVFTHQDQPFSNVRSIIEDKRGTIWLGGYDGLWRYDGRAYFPFGNKLAPITKNFVGYVYEDKKGNIWTSSQRATDRRWLLSKYDEMTLLDQHPAVTEINAGQADNKGMIFGMLEVADGSIWFGALDGVHRYDGKTITDFKGK